MCISGISNWSWNELIPLISHLFQAGGDSSSGPNCFFYFTTSRVSWKKHGYEQPMGAVWFIVCSYVGKNISVLNGSHEVAAFSGIALF